MARTQGSYPHPVIGHLDDVNSTFEIAHATVIPTSQDVELKFRVRSDDPDLKRMLANGTARLVFRWACGSTLNSGTLEATSVAEHVDGTTWGAWLDQEAIRDTVEVEVRVAATTYLPDYMLTRQHPDYVGQTFGVRPGDILGLAGSFKFQADKLYDPLLPPVGACFRFVEDPKIKRGVRVTFNDDEQVTVAMSSDLLTGLHALGDLPEAQVALVVLPALMETLAYIRNNEDTGEEDATDKLWYHAVLELANKVGNLQGDPLLELAQHILDYPIDTTLMQRLATEDDE